METTCHYQYDGTFDGFLSVVFHVYEHKKEPAAISQTFSSTPDMFAERISIDATEGHAHRVWEGLVNKTSLSSARLFHIAFRAGIKNKEMVLWRYVKKVFLKEHKGYHQNMLDEDVYHVFKMARQVKREAHLFLGLVRFEKSSDDIFFAPVEPDHDILDMIAGHFKSRFKTQKWVIYDTGRNYGIFYDLDIINRVTFENLQMEENTGKLKGSAATDKDDYFRRLWKKYYQSVNIQARENHKQLLRMMPRKYWKYLPEKQDM